MADPRITVPRGTKVRKKQSIVIRLLYGLSGTILAIMALSMAVQGSVGAGGFISLIAIGCFVEAFTKYRTLS